jgi:hypothetical protein
MERKLQQKKAMIEDEQRKIIRQKHETVEHRYVKKIPEILSLDDHNLTWII